MKIVVLAGGLSPERNVSLSSGTMIAHALKRLGHRPALVDLYFGLEDPAGPLEACFDQPVPDRWKQVDPQAPDLEAVKAARPGESPSQFGPGVLELCRQADLVFLALHGACGEDGRVQAAFDLMGIPYTGSGYVGSALAMDKDLTKRLVAPLGVKTPQWKRADYTDRDIDRLTSTTPVPCVVKPVASGSSIGVYIAHTQAELEDALRHSMELGGRTVLEQYIQGREIQVAVLGDAYLPAVEIIPKNAYFDYESKYQKGGAVEICPAPITDDEWKQVGQAALKLHKALGLSVYSRTDFILDEEGRAWCLEVNTLPGMTPTSLVPQEAAAAGMDYDTLCEKIAEESLRVRKAERL